MKSKRKHIKCSKCNGKGNIMVDTCEHDWKVKDDWSMTLGKQSMKCIKCKEVIIS